MWWLASCGPEDEASLLAHVRAAVRSVDGEVVTHGRYELGEVEPASPDLAGMVSWDDIAPGVVVVHGAAEGYAEALGVVDGRLGAAAGAMLTHHPADVATVDVGGPGALVVEGAVELTWEAALVSSADDLPATGQLPMAFAVVVDGRRALPGTSRALRNDNSETSLTLSAAVWFGAPTSEDVPLRFADGATLRWDGDRPEGTELYNFDRVGGAWRLLGDLDEGGARAIQSFGWFGLGTTEAPGGCVQGAVATALGAWVVGASIEVVADGWFGPLRGVSDEVGSFCVDVPAGRTLTLRTFGALAHGHALVAGERSGQGSVGACGGLCADVGTWVPQTYADRDGDGYPAGFGDCNDDEPAANPRLLGGDGSMCVVAL